jgi:hypothetical protein
MGEEQIPETEDSDREKTHKYRIQVSEWWASLAWSDILSGLSLSTSVVVAVFTYLSYEQATDANRIAQEANDVSGRSNQLSKVANQKAEKSNEIASSALRMGLLNYREETNIILKASFDSSKQQMVLRPQRDNRFLASYSVYFPWGKRSVRQSAEDYDFEFSDSMYVGHLGSAKHLGSAVPLKDLNQAAADLVKSCSDFDSNRQYMPAIISASYKYKARDRFDASLYMVEFYFNPVSKSKEYSITVSAIRHIRSLYNNAWPGSKPLKQLTHDRLVTHTIGSVWEQAVSSRSCSSLYQLNGPRTGPAPRLRRYESSDLTRIK